MRIGILGSGLMGGKLGTLFARAGHDVVFSYARSDQKLKRLAREAGGSARAGTPADAARDADALVLAVHWLRIDDVLQQALYSWENSRTRVKAARSSRTVSSDSGSRDKACYVPFPDSCAKPRLNAIYLPGDPCAPRASTRPSAMSFTATSYEFERLDLRC